MLRLERRVDGTLERVTGTGPGGAASGGGGGDLRVRGDLVGVLAGHASLADGCDFFFAFRWRFWKNICGAVAPRAGGFVGSAEVEPGLVQRVRGI